MGSNPTATAKPQHRAGEGAPTDRDREALHVARPGGQRAEAPARADDPDGQPPRRHVDALDGIRGVAVLLVLAYHAAVPFTTGGSIGVDVFFVLSGFLITTLLLHERAATGRIALRGFYGRRLVRLWPALLLVLGATGALLAVGVIARAPGSGPYPLSALATALYLSDVLAAVRPAFLDPVGHTWSLAVEMHFYLLWPLVVGVVASRSRPAVRLAVVAFASFAWTTALSSAAPVGSYVLPVTHGGGLLLGAALAFSGPTARARLARLGPAGAAVLVALTVLLPEEFGRLRSLGVAGASVATVVVLAWVLERPESAARIGLTSRPARLVGAWSYSLYLWHYPLLFGLANAVEGLSRQEAALVAVPLSFVLSAASWRFVERPTQQWYRRRTAAPAAAVAGRGSG